MSTEPTFSLVDLDPEILLQALEHLPAKSQAAARRTCKLFYVLIDEIGRTTSYLTSAVSSLSSVVSDLAPQLEAQPTLGILFAKDDVPDGKLEQLSKSLPYHFELIGGHMSVVAGTTSSGTLVQTNMRTADSSHEVALQLGRFPEAKVQSFAINPSMGSWRSQLEACGALTAGWKVFLLVSLFRETDAVVEALQAAHPDAAIIGGFATGRSLYRIHRHQVQCLDHGLVGLMFSGNVPLAAFVSRGARALTDAPYQFAADDLHLIQDREEDGEEQPEDNATQVLTHVTSGETGERQSALTAAIDNLNRGGSAGGGLCIGLADGPSEGYELTPLDQGMVLQSKEALLLPPRRGENQTWPSGSLKFYSFDPESCRADLTKRLTELKAAAHAKGDRLLGAVMFTCGGRTSHFFGEPAFDATTFARIFDTTPLIGMYAGGEIGPPLLAEAPASKAFQVGGATMHGFTAIFGFFIVPKRKARTEELAFADDEAVAEAFKELRRRAEPVPPPSSSGTAASGAAALREFLPGSVAELRALPVKALKAAMAKMGIGVVPGSEKEDLVMAIAPHLAEGASQPTSAQSDDDA